MVMVPAFERSCSGTTPYQRGAITEASPAQSMSPVIMADSSGCRLAAHGCWVTDAYGAPCGCQIVIGSSSGFSTCTAGDDPEVTTHPDSLEMLDRTDQFLSASAAQSSCSCPGDQASSMLPITSEPKRLTALTKAAAVQVTTHVTSLQARLTSDKCGATAVTVWLAAW